MRLAIQATPGLGIAAIATGVLALWPHATPSAPPLPEPSPERIYQPVQQVQPMDPCAGVTGILIAGHVTGGSTHVQLAGPIIYSDVRTDGAGNFELHVPIASDDVCSLLPAPQHYVFADNAMTLEYRVSLDR
jgi:hypothetical protein